jgi:uncharacterized protein (TIGR03000 family)
MYSAVLMLALTAGSETVDFGRNRCGGGAGYGCSGSIGCSAGYGGGCSGGYGGGCSSSYGGGGRSGLFSGGLFGGGGRHHGRSGGCSSGYGGCSSGYGYGGCTSGYGYGGCTSGYGYGGCTSGYGYGGCSTGGYIGGTSGCTSGGFAPQSFVPADKKMLPKGSEPVPAPKKTSQSSAPATIIVSLPADARLFVDGNATTSTTARRTLVTPELDFGTTYAYSMRVEIIRDGQVQSQTQQVNVTGGQTAAVQFNLSSPSVASR